MLSSTAVREVPASGEAKPDPARTDAQTDAVRDPVATAAFGATQRLMDSLLHDARNPLNALAINLEVLAEKLKDDEGRVPETFDKNIRAMRDQVYRVDTILRQFSDFIAPRLGAPAEVNVSELVQRALEVVGHEGRRRRVKIKAAIEPNATVAALDPAVLQLALVQVLLRALARSESGAEVAVVVDRSADGAVLTVSDPSVGEAEPLPLALVAAEKLCVDHGVRITAAGGTVQLTFSSNSHLTRATT